MLLTIGICGAIACCILNILYRKTGSKILDKLTFLSIFIAGISALLWLTLSQIGFDAKIVKSEKCDLANLKVDPRNSYFSELPNDENSNNLYICEIESNYTFYYEYNQETIKKVSLDLSFSDLDSTLNELDAEKPYVIVEEIWSVPYNDFISVLTGMNGQYLKTRYSVFIKEEHIFKISAEEELA